MPEHKDFKTRLIEFLNGKPSIGLILSICILSLLLGVGGYFLFVKKVSVSPQFSEVPSTIEDQEEDLLIDMDSAEETLPTTYKYPAPADDDRDYSSYYTLLVSQEGVSWLAKPEKIEIDDSKVFQCGDKSCGNDDGQNQYSGLRAYYKIGSYRGDDILYTNGYEVDPGGPYPAFLLANPARDRFVYLGKHSVPMPDESQYYTLAPGVLVDNTLTLSAINLPKNLTYKGTSFSLRIQDFFSDFVHNWGSPSELTLLTGTEYGPLFVKKDIETVDNTTYLEFGLRLPGGVLARANRAIPFMRDDGVPDITFLDGKKNEDAYLGQLGGCGRGTTPRVALTPIPDTELAFVGYTSTGEKVFNLINPEHPLIAGVFEMTGGTYYTYDSETNESIEHTYTREDFVASYGVLVYTDSLGYQNILTNSKYGPQAECGKPVIYLYPESTTTITVSVDAEVTKSEPLYEGGWTVTASPDGTLVMDNKKYKSLFWEGLGNGTYPARFPEGFVVPTSEALQTMASHLRYMGFIDSEIEDFTEFWANHLPEKPYTRISWITTEGMEELAKITINPRPDTFFRVFVDFEGLDVPIVLTEQKLPQYVRKGYVVTEWGGLLRHNAKD